MIEPPGTSTLFNPFSNSNDWKLILGPGQRYHNGPDYYSLDHATLNTSEGCGIEFKAPFDGTILFRGAAEEQNGYGFQVIIQAEQDSTFAFRVAHFEDVFVVVGQDVAAGEPLGTVGNTGNSSGCHSHSVLYRHIYSPVNQALESRTAKEYLEEGRYLSLTAYGSAKEVYAAPFEFSADSTAIFRLNAD